MATKRERDKQKARKTNALAWAKQQDKGGGSDAIKLPEGCELYKLEIGTHLVDFMPYLVGKGNKRADEGSVHFEREYAIHRVPSPSGRSNWYCCAWECFRKRCAVCDWLKENGRTAEEQLVKDLKISTRHLWLVNDKPGDKRPKLKIFDTNHYNRGLGFGEMMADAIMNVERYRDFAELEGGMTVQLTVKEQTWPGGKFNAVTRIDFLPRDYDYPDDLLDKAPCLDDCLIEPPYDDLRKMLGSEPGEAESPSRKPASRDKDDDEDERAAKQDRAAERSERNGRKEKTAEDLGIEEGMTVEYDGQEYTVKKVSGDGTSLTLEDEDGDLVKAIDPNDVEVIEEPTAKDIESDYNKGQEPARGKRGRAAKDDEDEDEDDEPEDGSDLEDEDDEDEDLQDSDLEDEDEDEDEDEERPPAKKPGKKPRR